MRGKLWTLLLVCMAATAPSIVRADVTLVQDGKPVAVIVAEVSRDSVDPPKAKAGKKRAARAAESDEAKAVGVLTQWIKKITDADLSVAAEPKAGVPAIYVGQAALKAGLKLDDIQSVSHEGVRIVVDGDRVLIAGQTESATLKGVCRFLEELGCRYFMDGPLGEVFPRSPTLTVKPMSITERPGLAGRHPKGPSWPDTGWRAWNGAGGEEIHHQHSWGGYVPASLFDKRPEWFAMGTDGQRKQGGWLCTSNPELRTYFADAVVAAIDRGTTHPSLSPTDGRGYCQCPACKAQDDPKSVEPSSGTVSISNRYVDFFDDVARRVGKVRPESVLSFICYADYTQPPTSGKRLSPNLCAVIAPIRYCRLHEIGHDGCPSRQQQLALTDGWAAVASKLGYYNYMYNLADGTLPMFKFTACKREFPYLYSKGVSFMTIEVLSNWQIYGPQIYLSLRLAYSPEADADAIMEDYFMKFYGPAAGPFMKQYWMGIDAATEALNSHAGSFYGLQQIYTPQFMAKCEELLAKAAEAARGNTAYEQRVALHAEGFKSAVEYRRISDAMARGDFAKADETLGSMVGRLKELGQRTLANREYGTAYVERFLAKPVRAGAAALAPPNKLVQVLPDRWRFAVDERDEGLTKDFHAAALDDSGWRAVSTYPATLDAQGLESPQVLWYRNHFTVPAGHGRLALFFGEIDGQTEVFVNGTRVAVPAAPVAAKKAGKQAPAAPPAPLAPAPGREGQGKSRSPFEVDVTEAVHEGENVLSLRVDHTKMTDLALGGILRPVVLIERR